MSQVWSESFDTMYEVIAASTFAQAGELEYHLPLGSFNGVVAHSNKADTFFSGERNHCDGVMSGFRYQCVEYARRFLLLTRGVVFTDCMRASEIFEKTTLQHVETGAEYPLTAHINGSSRPPAVGDLLIYPYVSAKLPWGHVGVVAAVGPDWVGVAEQNIDNFVWEGGRPFGRVVKLEHRSDGSWRTREDRGDFVDALGWMSYDAPEDRNAPRKPLPQFLPKPLRLELTRRRIKNIAPQTAAERSAWAFRQFDVEANDPAEGALLAWYRQKGLEPMLREFLNVYYPSEDLAISVRGYSNETFRAAWAALGRILHAEDAADAFDLPPAVLPALRRDYEASNGGRGCPLSSITMAVVDGHIKATGLALDSFAHFTEANLWQHRVSMQNGHVVGFASDVNNSLQLFAEKYFAPRKASVFFVDCGERSGDDAYTTHKAQARYMMQLVSATVACQWVAVEDVALVEGKLRFRDEQVTLVHTTAPWASIFAAARDRPAVHAVFVDALIADAATFLPLPCLAPTSSPRFYTDVFREVRCMAEADEEMRAALRLLLTPDEHAARGGTVSDFQGCFVREGATPYFTAQDGRPFEVQVRVFLVDNFSASSVYLEKLQGDAWWTLAAGRFPIRNPIPDDSDQLPETR